MHVVCIQIRCALRSHVLCWRAHCCSQVVDEPVEVRTLAQYVFDVLREEFAKVRG